MPRLVHNEFFGPLFKCSSRIVSPESTQNRKSAPKFPSLKAFMFITFPKSIEPRRAIFCLRQRIIIFITENKIFLFCLICLERLILSCSVIFLDLLSFFLKKLLDFSTYNL